MDPDETLDRLRYGIGRVQEGRATPMTIAELALNAADLDAWIMGGGYLPTDWNNAQLRARDE